VHLGHETDILLHGKVDVAEAEAWLATQGAGWLRLRDNGLVASSHMPGLDGSGPPRVYHLMADGVSKGAAVAHDLKARGLVPAQAVAVGDSSSDLEMAATVGRMHLVGNALRHPDVAAMLHDGSNGDRMANVVVEQGSLGPDGRPPSWPPSAPRTSAR